MYLNRHLINLSFQKIKNNYEMRKFANFRDLSIDHAVSKAKSKQLNWDFHTEGCNSVYNASVFSFQNNCHWIFVLQATRNSPYICKRHVYLETTSNRFRMCICKHSPYRSRMHHRIAFVSSLLYDPKNRMMVELRT